MNSAIGERTAELHSTRRTVLRGIGAAAAAACGLGAASGTAAASDRTSYSIRTGTEEETDVYVTEGAASGPTVLVVGGLHGNEACGYRAAERIKDWRIDAGTLVVLPRANVTAIEAGHRPWGTWDLNRHFPSGERPKSRLAQAIWDDVVVEHDPDFVWDLHSSRGIHSEDEGVGQAVFPTRAGDAREQAADVRAFLNDEYVPASMPTYEFTGSSSVDGTADMLKHKVGADRDTPSIIFETVYNGLSMARQVAWTSAAVWRHLRNYGLITRPERTITVTGRGETARYEFAVDGAVTSSAAGGAEINAYDEIDGGVVTGRTTNQSDSFRFTGSVVDFDADAPVDVTVDGDAVEAGSVGADVLTIDGGGSTARYEFTVDGDVEKSTAHGATRNGYDAIADDGTVTGRTTNEPDSYRLSGPVLDFEADGDVAVSLNGGRIEPAFLGASTVTIDGGGATAHYEFTVDGDVEKSTAHGATRNGYDAIADDGTVTGRTTNEPDSYAFTGVVESVSIDGSATVYADGEPVDLG